MNVNVTTQTVTFPCPLNKLKGHLMDSLGIQWMTPEGESFKLTTDMVPWIVHNAKTSMFNDNRCYVYNKALSTAFNTGTDISGVIKEIEERIVNNKFDLIRTWAEDKGIYAKGDSKTQYLKLMEEAGELSRAILKRDRPEIIDAIGDMVVVLTNLAKLENLDIEDCIDSAYNVIKNRKGKMENGTFVKNQTHSGTLNYTQTL